MSLNKGLAQNVPEDTAATARMEAHVRPKVMRRPATFSSVQGQPSMPTIHLPPATPLAETENENLALSVPPLALSVSAPTKLWQDDLRFGVAMLTILVLVNLALIAWLPHLRRGEPLPVRTEFTYTTPAAHVTQQTPLTIYAKPPEAAADTSPQDQPVTTEPPVHTLRSGADSGPDQ
jgi:hypothetical protein